MLHPVDRKLNVLYKYIQNYPARITTKRTYQTPRIF